MAKRLEPGFRGRDVKTLQRQLIRENDNALQMYGVDGSYGPETEQAVLTFQQKHSDIDNSGIADLTTQARLISVISYDLGSTGRGVKMLQEALMQFTIALPSGADGSYGPETKQGVQTFQQHNAILDNGIAGAVTFDTLDKALNTYYLEPGSSGTIYGSVTRMVQSQLNEVGFSLVVDGSYGPATEQAVRTFQEQEGLTVNGVAGPRTMNRLDIEAEAPLLDNEIITEAQKRGMITQSIDQTVQDRYIQKLESNPVFVKHVSEANASINAEALRIQDSDTQLISVFGTLDSDPDTTVFAIFDEANSELIRVSLTESNGTRYSDKAKFTTIEADGTKTIDEDVMWVDVEDQELQLQLEIKAALKDADTVSIASFSLPWGAIGCNIIAAVAGEITSFGILAIVGGGVPSLVVAGGGLVLGAVYGSVFC